MWVIAERKEGKPGARGFEGKEGSGQWRGKVNTG